MGKVGQMALLCGALLWFIGAQWRGAIPLSRGSCRVCAETSCFVMFRQTVPDEEVWLE